MFKKLMLSAFILTTVSQLAFAENKAYVGGSVGVTNLGYQSGKAEAGAIGKIFGGTGNTFGINRKLYLGGEVNLDLASYPNNNISSNLNYAVGASAIPGVMVTNNTMVYGRVGVQANKYNHGGNSTHIGNQLGLGVQTKVKTNWDARVEYINVSNVASTHDSQVNLGLVYNLN
jgi:opacity protein-like surface antigen